MTRVAYLTLRGVSAVSWWLRRRFTSPGLLVLAAAWAAAVLGVDTERSMSYQVFTLLLGLLIVAFPFAIAKRPRVTIQRSMPPLATAGDCLRYRITVGNPTPVLQKNLILHDAVTDPRPTYQQFQAAVAADWRLFRRPTLFDIWRKLLVVNGGAAIAESLVPELPADKVHEVTMALTPQRRGVLHFSNLTVARTDPLNLLKACADIPAPGHVLVLPKRYRLPELVLPGARRYQRGGVALSSSIGESEEFVSLRDYRPGDPLQRVHWKSFARVGYPIVKEFQDEFFERHALVLDTFGSTAMDAAFEEAVSIAASFAATVDTRERLLDLMFVGRATYCETAGRGQFQTQHLLEVLAAVPRNVEGEFGTLADSVLAARAHLSSAILVLLGWDQPRQNLVSNLQASGLPVLVLVVLNATDPIVTGPQWLCPVRVGRVEESLASLEA